MGIDDYVSEQEKEQFDFDNLVDQQTVDTLSASQADTKSLLKGPKIRCVLEINNKRLRPFNSGSSGKQSEIFYSPRGRLLKFVRPQSDDEARERLRREFETLSKIRHPFILKAFPIPDEWGIAASPRADGLSFKGMGEICGQLCFEMERVRGRDLANAVDFLNPLELLAISIQIAEALKHLHGLSYVHGDPKPANIIWDQKLGQAKLVDLGLVKTPKSTLTRPKGEVGTPRYMPPQEDLRTPLADLHGYGVTIQDLIRNKIVPPARKSTICNHLNEIAKRCIKSASNELPHKDFSQVLTDLYRVTQGRPPFPSGFRNEVNVIYDVTAGDVENDSINLRPVAKNSALLISNPELRGTKATVRVVRGDDGWTVRSHKKNADDSVELMLSGNRSAVVMVEGDSFELAETELAKALDVGHKAIKKRCKWLSTMKAIGGLAIATSLAIGGYLAISWSAHTKAQSAELFEANTQLENWRTQLYSAFSAPSEITDGIGENKTEDDFLFGAWVLALQQIKTDRQFGQESSEGDSEIELLKRGFEIGYNKRQERDGPSAKRWLLAVSEASRGEQTSKKRIRAKSLHELAVVELALNGSSSSNGIFFESLGLWLELLELTDPNTPFEQSSLNSKFVYEIKSLTLRPSDLVSLSSDGDLSVSEKQLHDTNSLGFEHNHEHQLVEDWKGLAKSLGWIGDWYQEYAESVTEAKLGMQVFYKKSHAIRKELSSHFERSQNEKLMWELAHQEILGRVNLYHLAWLEYKNARDDDAWNKEVDKLLEIVSDLRILQVKLTESKAFPSLLREVSLDLVWSATHVNGGWLYLTDRHEQFNEILDVLDLHSLVRRHEDSLGELELVCFEFLSTDLNNEALLYSINSGFRENDVPSLVFNGEDSTGVAVGRNNRIRYCWYATAREFERKHKPIKPKASDTLPGDEFKKLNREYEKKMKPWKAFQSLVNEISEGWKGRGEEIAKLSSDFVSSRFDFSQEANLDSSDDK